MHTFSPNPKPHILRAMHCIYTMNRYTNYEKRKHLSIKCTYNGYIDIIDTDAFALVDHSTTFRESGDEIIKTVKVQTFASIIGFTLYISTVLATRTY